MKTLKQTLDDFRRDEHAPCKKCGGKAGLTATDSYWYCYCLQCGVETGHYARADHAVMEWERRNKPTNTAKTGEDGPGRVVNNNKGHNEH